MESHRQRLLYLKNKGFRPRTILDVGAFQGGWTLIAKQTFPQANCFMVEANKDMEPFLQQTKIPYSISLLAKEDSPSRNDYCKTANEPGVSGNSMYLENSPNISKRWLRNSPASNHKLG